MTTHRITNWTAKRVGAGITVTGKGASGEPVKLTLVAEISRVDDGSIAVLSSGDRVALA